MTLPMMKALLEDSVPSTVQKIQCSAKIIAFRTGASPRCVEGIRQGEHLPSLPVALSLAREYPEMRELLTSYMEAGAGENERDPGQVLDDIQRLLAARQE